MDDEDIALTLFNYIKAKNVEVRGYLGPVLISDNKNICPMQYYSALLISNFFENRSDAGDWKSYNNSMMFSAYHQPFHFRIFTVKDRRLVHFEKIHGVSRKSHRTIGYYIYGNIKDTQKITDILMEYEESLKTDPWIWEDNSFNSCKYWTKSELRNFGDNQKVENKKVNPGVHLSNILKYSS